MSDVLNALLADVGKLLGMEGLAVDTEGSCLLQFDNVLVQMDSIESGEFLLCYVDLGTPPGWGVSPEFYESLLAANFLGVGTGGACLGMNREAGFIALSQTIPIAGVTGSQLVTLLENLVDHAEAWLKRLPELAAQNASQDRVPGDAESGVRV